MFKKIVVPVDGSAHANRAVDCATDLANKYGAELILLHVMASTGPARIPAELYEYARIEHIDDIEADIMKRVAEEILQTAENRARGQGAKAGADIDRVGQSSGIDRRRRRRT